MRWGSHLALLVLLASCGNSDDSQSSAPPVLPAQLRPGVVAAVGSQEIVTDTVVRIAKAQRVSPKRAVEQAISDAVLAEGARDTLPEVVRRRIERGALARSLLEQLQAQAKAQGPITDAELEQLTAERWLEIDRPAGARVQHAVVMLKEGQDEAQARRAAERIAKATASADSQEAFEKSAKTVDVTPFELKVELLAPVTQDGRIIPARPPEPGLPPARYDATFAKAAHAIDEVGTQGPVTRTPFGFHVMRLVEKTPEQRLSVDQRREALQDEAWSRRARGLESALLERLSKETSVEIARAAGDLTAKVVAPR